MFGMHTGAMILTQSLSKSSLSTSLPIGTIYVNNTPLNVLFDTGSQVNTITPTTVDKLKLDTIPLKNEWSLSMANQTVARPTRAVQHLTVSFDASDGTSTYRIDLPSAALVLDSYFDVILGNPFLTKWNIYPHHCNSSLVYFDQHGILVTIRLHNTNSNRCIPHCPFERYKNKNENITPKIPNTNAKPNASNEIHQYNQVYSQILHIYHL